MSDQELEAPNGAARGKINYALLFHRMTTERLSFRQLATLPEAQGVSRQAIQKEFKKPQWRQQKDALDAAEIHGRVLRSPVAAGTKEPAPREYIPPAFIGNQAETAGEDGAAKAVAAQHRADIQAARERIAADIETIRRIEDGEASDEERKRVLGVNRQTIMDAKQKLDARMKLVIEMEAKAYRLDERQMEIRQFLPFVARRGVPTMPDQP